MIDFYIENREVWGTLMLVLATLNLLAACALYKCFQLVMKYLMKKMDIQLTYVLLRGCILAFLMPLLTFWEVTLERSQEYWVAISERFGMILLTIGCVWCVGSLVSLIYQMAVGIRLSRWIRKGSTPATREWKETLAELCAERQMKVPDCREQMGDCSAMVLGVLHPTIYVPMGHFGEEQRKVIMTHELTHIDEHDLLWKRLTVLCRSLCWFCPMVYRLSKDLNDWSEYNCDFVSSKLLGGARDYFDVMMEMVSDGYQWNQESWTARFGCDMPELMRRMRTILNQQRLSPRRIRWIFVGMLVFLFCGSSMVFAAGSSAFVICAEVYWEGSNIIYEVQDTSNDGGDVNVEPFQPDSAMVQKILQEGLREDQWSSNPRCWMDVDSNESGGFTWLIPSDQIYLSPEVDVEAGDHMGLGISIEAEDMTVIGGWIGPDNQIYCTRMHGDAYDSHDAEAGGTYRFFIWNPNAETVNVFGYDMIFE